MTDGKAGPGFHGKLPSHGDFLTRRLPAEFTDAWDGWLQQSMAMLKTDLGADGWLPAYLKGPIWRFAMQPGICGGGSWAGILMPSVDKVGRYFPLTIAAPLEPDASPLRAAIVAGPWFEAAEAAALQVLAREEIDLAQFDAEVAALGYLPGGGNPVADPPSLSAISGPGLAMPMDSAGLPGVLQQLVDSTLEPLLRPYVLWWSEGSELVTPMAAWSRGLPRPEGFSALFGRGWQPEHWAMGQSHAVSAGAATA